MERELTCEQANFSDSREKIVRLLRAVWMRKKMERERRQWTARLDHLREQFKTVH